MIMVYIFNHSKAHTRKSQHSQHYLFNEQLRCLMKNANAVSFLYFSVVLKL